MVLGLALLFASGITYEFFPGFTSFDTLEQLKQTLGLEPLKDAHPVIMVQLWRALLQIYDHPGVLLAFHQVLYWSGIGLFACLITDNAWLRVGLLLILGFFPPLVILSLHLWKDVEMLGALTVATALLVGYVRRPHWAWLLASLAALFFAVAVRINGFIPALPLLLLICHFGATHVTGNKWKSVALTLFSAIAFVMCTMWSVTAISSGAKKVYGLGTLLVWDMVSISLATHQDLVPPYLKRHTSGDLLTQLAEKNSTEANYPSYLVVSPFPPKHLERQLLKDWMTLVARYPKAYFEHRLHVFAVLLGVGDRPIYYPYHPGIDENNLNLKFENITKAEVQAYFNFFDKLAETIVYRPWVYMVLSLIVVCAAGVRTIKNRGNALANQLAVAISTSGILAAASLFVIATAADYRYITWTILAALLSFVVLIADVLGIPALARDKP